WFGDTWKLLADNGQTYKLDDSLKPLNDGERYQIVSAADTKSLVADFLRQNAYGRNQTSAGLGSVFSNSPTNQQWDWKDQNLTADQKRTNLFALGDGVLYHADYVGNVAWGFIMASFGYPESVSKAGAVAYQIKEAF